MAAKAGAHLTVVLCVKNHLNDCAAMARKKGFVGDFDLQECAVALDTAPETVASIVRVLVDIEWLGRNQVITHWLDEQPELEDPTATDRQRLKRRRDEAKNRAAIGMATDEDLELLTVPERVAMAKLAALSRVTAAPPAPPPPERITPFVPIQPKENSYGAMDIAHQENKRAARAWLVGDGVSAYGPASKIVADNFGCNRMSADGSIRGWMEELDGDVVILATLISAAEQQSLTGDAFRKVVEQRIETVIRERTAGPTLPFGVSLQPGGKQS